MDERVDFFLPLYVRDFIAATLGWTAAERGHYLTLLMVQWDRGSLPADLPSLERLSPGVGESWGLLEAKFPVAEDGQRRNRRLEEHRTKALDARRRRKEAGAKGGRGNAKASPKQCSSNAQAMLKQPEPEPEPYWGEGEGARRDAPEAPPSPADVKMGKGRSVDGKVWSRLRDAWNAGVGAPWRSTRPPPEAMLALADDGWIDVAMAAIERLPQCKYFQDPVDLSQFCTPGFADKVLGGRYDRRFRKADASGPVERRPRPDCMFAGKVPVLSDEEYARERRRIEQQEKFRREREEAKRERQSVALATSKEGGR